MTANSIFNFIALDERIGTGGQPTAEQLRAARAEGYEAVINLAPGTGERALAGEADLVRSLGMDYRHIPVDWQAPRVEDFALFSDAMAALGDKKLLIHCVANYRVTAFVSSYAIKHMGWSEDRADALVERIWTSSPDYHLNDTWRAFLATIRR